LANVRLPFRVVPATSLDRAIALAGIDQELVTDPSRFRAVPVIYPELATVPVAVTDR
jgi:hypothetical protein